MVLCGKRSGLHQRNYKWDKIVQKCLISCCVVLLDSLALCWSAGSLAVYHHHVFLKVLSALSGLFQFITILTDMK